MKLELMQDRRQSFELSDDEYYLSVSHLLEIARDLPELFEKAEYADTIIRYLDCALENGAKLGFELQHQNENGENEILDYGGNSIGEWANLRRN